MRTTFQRRAALATAALALWGFTTVAAFGQGEAETLSSSFRKATRRVLPAVVTVRPLAMDSPFELPPGRRFIPGPRLEGGGSGVVIDAGKGYVLTNDHVVQNASRVAVILANGRERVASQVRRDPKSDLALLIIEPKGLTQVEWGDSDALDMGDWVLAIGHPFGLDDTVTAGIVSGKGRGLGMTMYEDLIQTDAAINPGNSGGPLINLKGEVVGISAAMVGNGYDGIGFAIPSSRARRVASDLAGPGHVRRAYLGIQIGPVDREAAERLDQAGAVVVNGVSPDSPAAEAGLKRGDILLQYNGKPIAGVGPLQSAIEVATAGEPVTLAIDREGERREIKVAPKEQPETFGVPEVIPQPFRPRFRGRVIPIPPVVPEGGLPRVEPPRETELRVADVAFPKLGLRLSERAPALAQRFRVGRPTHGLMIVGVEPDGPADRGGLEVGMLVTDVGNRQVETTDDFRDAVAKRSGDGDIVLRILKGSKAEYRLIRTASGEKAPETNAPSGASEPSPNPKPN